MVIESNGSQICAKLNFVRSGVTMDWIAKCAIGLAIAGSLWTDTKSFALQSAEQKQAPTQEPANSKP
jgi:hypothetical protein